MVKRDVYTHGHQPAAVNQHAKRTAESCAQFVRSVVEPGSQILDVGCGPASITVGLAKWAAAGSVTAIDVGEEIVVVPSLELKIPKNLDVLPEPTHGD